VQVVPQALLLVAVQLAAVMVATLFLALSHQQVVALVVLALQLQLD
jgi:hypothetical protein